MTTWPNGQIAKWLNDRMVHWTDGWVTEWPKDWRIEWPNDLMSKWSNGIDLVECTWTIEQHERLFFNTLVSIDSTEPSWQSSVLVFLKHDLGRHDHQTRMNPNKDGSPKYLLTILWPVVSASPRCIESDPRKMLEAIKNLEIVKHNETWREVGSGRKTIWFLGLGPVGFPFS